MSGRIDGCTRTQEYINDVDELVSVESFGLHLPVLVDGVRKSCPQMRRDCFGNRSRLVASRNMATILASRILPLLGH